jgi:hypothetical protein
MRSCGGGVISGLKMSFGYEVHKLQSTLHRLREMKLVLVQFQRNGWLVCQEVVVN